MSPPDPKDTSVSTLAKRYRKQGLLVNLVLAAATGLLLIGLFGPLFTLHQFWIFDHRVSLISGLGDLFAEEKYFLFTLIAAFSVLLPLVKLGVLAAFWNLEPQEPQALRRHLQWIAHYGKWSMLDVFVVAVLIVSVKLGAIARVEIHYGFYAFSGSVLLSMIITTVLSRLGKADNA